MTAADALRLAVPQLKAAGVSDPGGDARILLAASLGIDRSRLILLLGDDLPITAKSTFGKMLAARINRQPVSQIVGYREFYGRRFRVTPDVLDPRPETERLVELALTAPFSRVLDLGTGSGCILLSLLAENPQATGLGVDCSGAALDVARQNASTPGIAERAEFHQSDWFGAVTGRFDLIVSNPPYISAPEMDDLAPELRLWEPRFALSPEGDGLDAYRLIIQQCAGFLDDNGRVLLEIGPTQGMAVLEMLQRAGFADCRVRQDLDGRDRVVEASKTGNS